MEYECKVMITDEGNVVLQFFKPSEIQKFDTFLSPEYEFATSMSPEYAEMLGEHLKSVARRAEKKKKEKERQELLEAYEQGKMAAEEALSKLLNLAAK